MNFKEFDPKQHSIQTIYHLMISGIAPRPIALVGSRDKKNCFNLAPFSFFNAFGSNPPILGFSPTLSGQTGQPKDTLINIQETKEFTISVVTSNIIGQMSLASCEFDSNIDEFLKAGFTKYNSKLIAVPGVQESPFIMECKLYKILKLGEKHASGNLILGEVVLFHINESIIDDKNTINPFSIDQIGRSGGSWYTEIKKSLFSFNKPSKIGIGFDNIPRKFLNSNLTGNQLAKLAGLSKIPDVNHGITIYSNFNKALDDITGYLDENEVDKAWQVILNWENNNG